MSERRWSRAREEHRDALAQFAAAVEGVPEVAWTRPTAPGKWSPAAVVLHVTRAYELGHDAIAGGAGMRMRVRPLQAWVLRTFLLPYFLASGRFPRGADAPREVVPDLEEANRMSVASAVTRLSAAASVALETFTATRHASRTPKVRHAYFGDLTLLSAFRLLSAHTKHHARGLAHANERGL